MKIDYAIHSSDSNPMYLDFWPIVSKIWKLKFNVTPLLIYIDEDHSINIDDTYGEVVKMKPIEGIPLYLQNLWVRYWYTSQKPDSVNIISDIDMLPLSKKYFVDTIADIDDNSYVHINPCIETYGIIPSCYHIAKGSKYKEVLDLHDNWEDSIKFLFGLNMGNDPGGHLAGKNHWFADEYWGSKKVIERMHTVGDVVLIKRNGGQNGFRIDRPNWGYDEALVPNDYYYDSHSLRPYQDHKDEIDKLVNLVLSGVDTKEYENSK
tara:strand:- start:7880 stop:8668 length:789 start_codon:yes stop_codon:yes gene_type:complete